MKRTLILVALGLFLCSTASASQGGGGESTKKAKRKVTRIIEGTISGYECGDNCYLTITDRNGKEHLGLCSAPVCSQWNRQATMPDSYKGKRVRVTIGNGTLLTYAGDNVGTFDAFTRIQFLTAPSTVSAQPPVGTKPVYTIEGSVISSGGMAGMSDFIIESGGKRYSGSIDQRGYLNLSPGSRVRVTYLGTVPCGMEPEVPCLNTTGFVRLASREVDSASTKTDKNGFQAFFKEFCSAVRKRDRVALELMMSSTFEFRSGAYSYANYEQPSVVFDSLDKTNGEGWKELEKSVATGTKPYKDSSPQIVARVTNSKDYLVLFGLGSDGKWQWLRFLGW